MHGLGLFHGNDTVAGHLFHRIGDHLADFVIAGGNRRYARDLFLAGDGAAHSLDGFDSFVGCRLHAAPQDDRICTGRQVLHAFVNHRLRQNGRGGGAVAGYVVGLGSNFLDQLSPHIFKTILQLNLLRDGHAVVGDERGTVGFIQNHVASFRA